MPSKRTQCLTVCVGSLAVFAWWILIDIDLLNWFVAASLLTIVCVSADIYRLDPSAYQTTGSMISQYLHFKFYQLASYVAYKRFQTLSQDVASAQTETLKTILEGLSGTAFAKDHGLESVRTVDEFRKAIPLTEYDDYLPYVNRVLEGEDNVMFSDKADYIATTTGTTSSKSKMYPKSMSHHSKNALKTVGLLGFASFQVPESEKLRKTLFTGCFTKAPKNKQGIRTGPVSAAFDSTSSPHWSTPKVAAQINNEEQKVYVDLLFGLRDKNISAIYSFIAPTALFLFTTLEKYWHHLCEDIERGTLYSGIQLSAELRYELEKLCRSDPTRAIQLRHEFCKGFNDIVTRIWPHCKTVFAVSSGTFQVYADVLRKKYLGNVPILSQCHAATEGFFGVNLWPEWSDDHYVPTVGAYFFEWLPAEGDSSHTVLTHEVELGRHYEMVITTFDGLCRYRTGDLVEFKKFFYRLPTYQFVRRLGDLVKLHTLKIPEAIVSHILRKTFSEHSDVNLIDYAITESIYFEKLSGSVKGGVYGVVFVEMDGEAGALSDVAKRMDDEMCLLFDSYRRCRGQEVIQVLQLIPLRSGAFKRFKALRMSANPHMSNAQYKVLRIVRNEDFVNFFLGERA